MSTFEKPCKPSGIMGTVSSQTLSSARVILEGLRALEQLLRVIFSENRESEDTHKKIDFSFISPKRTFE